MSENYFEHFDLERKFFIDSGELKKLYYLKSKELHPDFHTLEDNSLQERITIKSSVNNEAYRVLKDFSSRLFHILQLEGMVKEEGDNSLPQEFLMEMMEVNERIMELEFDYDAIVHNGILKEVEQLKEENLSKIKPLMEAYDEGNRSSENLNQIRDFYFKQKYLWRIQENLDKFAAQL